jgi:adenylate cyclase
LEDLWLWLLDAGEGRPNLDDLFGRFCAELARRGLPIYRASLGLELLHPEVSGTRFVWTDTCVPVSLFEAARSGIVQSASYQNSPTRIVDETDRPFRRRLDAPCHDMPLLEELRSEGATDYVMLPLPFIERTRTAVMAFAGGTPAGSGRKILGTWILLLASSPLTPSATCYGASRLT